MLDELRDEAARLCGWECRSGVWLRVDRRPHPLTEHPFPPNDLNPVAREWPEGWKLYLSKDPQGKWWADGTRVQARGYCFDLGSFDTEYEARLRLFVAAKKEATNA